MNTAFTKDELVQKLNDIESQYSLFYCIIYPELELERMTFELEQDSAIYEKVDALLNARQLGETENVKNNYANCKSELEKCLKALEVDSENLLEKLNVDYESKKSALIDDALKRGMGKSSALVNIVAKLNEKYLEEKNKFSSDYLKKKSQLDKELSDAVVKYTNELNLVQLNHMQEKINLVEQFKKENNEKYIDTLKYNNQLTEKEKEFAKANKDSILKQANEDTISQTSMMNEKIRLFNSFFSGCAAADVVTELTNEPIYKKYLGEHGYNLYLKYYQDMAAITTK